MLLIDIGNSAIKTRWIHQGQNHDRTFSHRYADSMEKMQRYLQKLSPQFIYIASVCAEQTLQAVMQWINRQFSQAQIQLLKSLPVLDGLVNHYDDHEQLGVDRWLAVVAARQLSQQDCIIIDAGTAITIEVLSQRQGFLGGAIMPGLNTTEQRFKSLFPDIDFDQQQIKILDKPGLNTVDGLYLPDKPVSISLIQAILKSWEKRLNDSSTVILTGQDAEVIGRQLMEPHQVIPDLVFTGMLKQIQLLR